MTLEEHFDTWIDIVEPQLKMTYFKNLQEILKEEYKNKTIYPNKEDIFRVFRITPIEKVNVVLLGLDPYIRGEATGLSFAVNEDCKITPTLDNILKDIEKNVYNGLMLEHSWDLIDWAVQGVFLLNRYLTVEKGKTESHANIGWDIFTDYIISVLSEKRVNLVFILLGKKAQEVYPLIDKSKHLVLKAEHPAAALYRENGVWNSENIWNKTNEYLKQNNKQQIKW